jgi:uncharacterized protein (TIGR00730 family)
MQNLKSEMGESLLSAFLLKDSWRVFRILAEFVDGFEIMPQLGPAVSIFGSARVKPHTPEYELAVNLAQKIANKGFSVITGGGPGIMEAANKGARQVGRPSCGLTIELPFETGANSFVDTPFHLHFRYFFVRKVMFVRYAKAFVALPGGYGTLDELFEALTLIQTQKIKSFPIYLVGKSYWQGLLDWIKNTMVAHNYLSLIELDLIHVTDDLDEVAEGIARAYTSNEAKEHIL